MAFQVGNFKAPSATNAIAAKKAAMEAAKQRALGSGEAANPAAIQKWVSPAECAERNRIVFDDSGSMCGQIENAKNGVVEYLRNCIPNQTAVAVHFMNTKAWSTKLRTDLPMLGTDILESSLSSGGTPFFNTLKHALEAEPKLTRLIAFTDGAPTDRLQGEEGSSSLAGYYSFDSRQGWISSADVIIKIAQHIGGEKCIPIDTVYFGGRDEDSNEIQLLKYLSEKTGGIFLHFDPAKVNFRTAFKYLAPTKRLMLADKSFRDSLERGEQK